MFLKNKNIIFKIRKSKVTDYAALSGDPTIMISATIAIVVFIVHLSRRSYQPISNLGGAHWLSGRVLDTRPRGCGFEPHRCHCVVVIEQDTFILA